MKNLIEILGDAQILFDISYDIQAIFEETLTPTHKTLLVLFRTVEEYLGKIDQPMARTGRPPIDNLAFFRAYLIKSFFQINKTSVLIRMLKADTNLRMMCGFKKVPDAASFSRRLCLFSELQLPDSIHTQMISAVYKDEIVHTNAQDSTIIHAREKAINKKSDEKPIKIKQKRGRKKKGTVIPPKPDLILDIQRKQDASTSLASINKKASWTCKQNSQGKVQYSKGYKLHLSVDGNGIPLVAILTGANVHDSQLSIPMLKLVRTRTTVLYTMADSAYDAPQIKDEIVESGSVPVIDRNKRRSKVLPPEDPVHDRLYKNRTVVERANSHLKGSFLPTTLYIKGFQKVNFIVMMGVLVHTAIKILHTFVIPSLPLSEAA